MLFSTASSLARQLLNPFGKLLPIPLIEQLGKIADSNPLALKLAQLGVCDRDVILTQGVGKGIKFNCGKAHPDFALGRYELPLQETLASYLKPGQVFYDIGANIGFFTTLGAKLVGTTGQVYAFEPVPDNAKMVRYNAQLNNFSHVTVIEKAVSGDAGMGELLLTEHIGGSTLSEIDTPPDVKGSMTVEIVSIDNLIHQGQIKPPVLAKIDVEGAELNVLEGMKQTLQEHQPIIIYEVDDNKQESFQQKQTAIADFLKSLNYQIKSLEDSYKNTNWLVGHCIAFPPNYSG